jgi:hypothetical protein
MRLPDFSPLGSSIWLRRSGVLMAFHGLAEVRATHHGKCADSHIGLAVVEALVPRVERMEELDHKDRIGGRIVKASQPRCGFNRLWLERGILSPILKKI